MSFTIDLNGHYGRAIGQIDDAKTLRDVFNEFFIPDIERGVGTEKLFAETRHLMRDRPDLAKVSGLARLDCSHCGKKLKQVLDGDHIRVTSPVCEGNIDAYSVDLDVPSGMIVFANDLRSLVRVDEESGDHSKLGLRKIAQSYAAQGMVHMYVGNSCPGVFENAEGGLSIAAGIGKTSKVLGLTKRVGGICTDLWWFCAMDYGHFLRRCLAEGRKPDEFDHFTVPVPEGTYTATDLLRRNDGKVVFATIARAEQRKPLVETVPASDLELFERFFTKYRSFGSHRRLEHALFSLGNGYEWVGGNLSEQSRRPDKPYGQGSADRPRQTYVDQVPVIVELEGWRLYPQSTLTRDYGIRLDSRAAQIPLDVNPYWLAAALMATKTYLNGPNSCFEGWYYKKPEEREKLAEHIAGQRRILDETLNLLCEVVTARGLEDDLIPIFVQVQTILQSYADTVDDD